jgi:hypothetical protein
MLRVVMRSVAALAVLVGSVVLFVTGAGAGTVSTNPNSAGIACHLAFSTTSGAAWTNGTIGVQGDCNSPNLLQFGTPTTTGCLNATCGYNAGDPITSNLIAAYYWTGAHEIEVKIGTSVSAIAFNNNEVQYCGFNQGDVAINDTPTSIPTGGSFYTEQDSAATASLQAHLPSGAGTYIPAISTPLEPVEACTTSGTTLGVYVEVEDVGTTNGGTAAYLYQNNGACEQAPTGYATYCTSLSGAGFGGAYAPGGVWFNGTLATTSNDDVPAACGLTSITGNESGPAQVAGQEYPYTVDFSGEVDDIVATDTSETSVTENVQGKVLDVPFLQDIDPGPGLTTSQTINYMAATGDVVNPTFWCYAEGVWYDWGSISSIDTSGLQYVPPNSGPPDTTVSCWAGSWSITDIGTDLLNVGKDFECVLQLLFEPSSAQWQAVENLFGFTNVGAASGSCSATSPGGVSGSVSQWIGAGFLLIVDGPSCSFGTMQSEEAAGETDSVLSSGDTFTSGGKSFSSSLPLAMSAISGPASNSELTTELALILLVETAVLAVMFFFAMKKTIQKLLGNGA